MNSVVSLCLALLLAVSSNSAPVPEVEGHPACRPTAEAREKIHAVMVQTFGKNKAADIKKNFDQCAHDHPGDAVGHLACLQGHFSQAEVTAMVDALTAAHITWECEEKRELGENEGRPACRPTLEARKQIHAVMEQTFGVEKAAEIKGIFDQCARDHRDDPIGHLGCLRSQFTQEEVTEMVNAIKKAHITWQCEEKREMGEYEGRPACRPTLEARKKIHAVMQQTFGDDKAADIQSIFDQCARDHPGDLGCLRSQFTQEEVTEMVNAIKKAHITWQCEEKREMEREVCGEHGLPINFMGYTICYCDDGYKIGDDFKCRPEPSALSRRNEGRPACRPTLEARKQIHAVMQQTFGDEKAADIQSIFDQCAHDHPGDAIGHLACLRGQFSQEEVTEMVNAIKKAHITWQCEEKREMGDDEGRPACRPTPEARKEIHAVMVKTFGEKDAAEIEQNFEKCAEAHIGKPVAHLKCLRDHFSQAKVTEMVAALKDAKITWECEETK